MSCLCVHNTSPGAVVIYSVLFTGARKMFFKRKKRMKSHGYYRCCGIQRAPTLKKSQGKVERERKELRGKWGQKCCLPSPEEEKTVEVLWYLLTSCSPSSSSSCTFWDIFLPCSLTTGHMITQDSFSSLLSFLFPFFTFAIFSWIFSTGATNQNSLLIGMSSKVVDNTRYVYIRKISAYQVWFKRFFDCLTVRGSKHYW